jgi:DNA-binding transcriptional LysR family regulator
MDPRKLGLIASRLQYFQAVVSYGSIRRASQFLNVAPSAISRSIRQMEEELGALLFERIRQRLRLTSAGETLAYHARTSHRELSRACAFIEDLQGLRRGRISIVAVESAMRGMLPRALSAFWQRHPNVSVELRTAGSREAADAVANGDCDLALIFDTRVPRSTRRLASADVGLGALVRPDHPAAKLPGARLRDFAEQKILLADSSLSLGKLIEDAALQAGIDLQVRAITNSINELIEFTVNGHGITFQTRVGVERELERGELAFVPLLDRTLKPRKLTLIAAGHGQLPEAPASLALMLTQAVTALDETPATDPT